MANERVLQSALNVVILETPNLRVLQSAIQLLTIPSPVLASCNNPPGGLVGTFYTTTFTVVGGIAPYTWTLISGTLPTGLTLDPATGVLSGTPTANAAFSFTLQVTDSTGNSAQITCSITIGALPTVGCNSPPSGTVGIFYSHLFTLASGAPPYTLAIIAGSLPPGLSLDSGLSAVTALFADAETPAGAVNGSNVTFTLANIPAPAASLRIFLNGVEQTVGTDFTLAIGTITFTTAPAVGDQISADYRYFTVTSFNVGLVDNETPAGTLDGVNAVFTLANTPAPTVAIRLYVNGVRQLQGTNFTLAGNTITFTTAPLSTDILRSFYRSNTVSSTTGLVAGIPTAPGVYPFTLLITDSLGNTNTVNCSITILGSGGSPCIAGGPG